MTTTLTKTTTLTTTKTAKKFLTYDLETTFLQKGGKRPSQRILEIAMYTVEKQYQRLVNPIERYATGKEVIESLNEIKQHPESTLRFWTKLLIEKSALASQMKRKSIEDQADAISELLTRSEIARRKSTYSTRQWLYALEEHHDEKAARQFLDKHSTRGMKPKSVLFYTTKESLEGALEFAKEYDPWACIAHNGKSFDMPIVLGNAERCDIRFDVPFQDSLPMFRRKLPGHDSYSQPLLYRDIFHHGYKAHHALDDAKALYELMEHALKKESLESLFHVKKLSIKVRPNSTDLRSIKGVGPKSAAIFVELGIKNKKQLNAWMKKYDKDQFMKTFSSVYAYRKLADRLYDNLYASQPCS